MVGAPLATFQPLFQSTLSMRRATRVPAELVHTFVISIHALHEESDKHAHDGTADATKISIHALHEESDQVKADFGLIIGISIHALHEESDHIPYCLCGMGNHFNPRSP